MRVLSHLPSGLGRSFQPPTDISLGNCARINEEPLRKPALGGGGCSQRAMNTTGIGAPAMPASRPCSGQHPHRHTDAAEQGPEMERRRCQPGDAMMITPQAPSGTCHPGPGTSQDIDHSHQPKPLPLTMSTSLRHDEADGQCHIETLYATSPGLGQPAGGGHHCQRLAGMPPEYCCSKGSTMRTDPLCIGNCMADSLHVADGGHQAAGCQPIADGHHQKPSCQPATMLPTQSLSQPAHDLAPDDPLADGWAEKYADPSLALKTGQQAVHHGHGPLGYQAAIYPDPSPWHASLASSLPMGMQKPALNALRESAGELLMSATAKEQIGAPPHCRLWVGTCRSCICALTSHA